MLPSCYSFSSFYFVQEYLAPVYGKSDKFKANSVFPFPIIFFYLVHPILIG